MSEIKKIKGKTLMDVKARQSIKYLNNKYKNLISIGESPINILNDFTENKNIVTGEMEKQVSTIIDDLEEGIYKCPMGTGQLKIFVRVDDTLRTLQTFTNCSYMFIYIIYKDKEKIIYDIGDVEYTCYFTTQDNYYSLKSQILKLSCDNDIAYEPKNDYNPATKKYVDEHSSNINEDELVTNYNYLKYNNGSANIQFYDLVFGTDMIQFTDGTTYSPTYNMNQSIDNDYYLLEIRNENDEIVYSYIHSRIAHPTIAFSSSTSFIFNNKKYTIMIRLTLQSTFDESTNTIIPSEGKSTICVKFANTLTESDLAIIKRYKFRMYTADKDYLSKKANREFIPTEYYHPATKKYVDDKGTLEFNEDGDLVVTINGVSKVFTPKE